MIRALSILLAVLSIIGCAPSIKRLGYSPDVNAPKGNYEVKFNTELRDVTGYKKLGSISIYDNGLSINCSAAKVMGILDDEARRMGATMVNLYNIQDPSPFGSSCFQTNADFYAPDSSGTLPSQTQDIGIKLSDKAVLEESHRSNLDSIGHGGLELQVGFDIGFVLSGGQKDLALIATDPAPDGVQCFGWDVSATKWWNWIGASTGYSYASASATKKDYEPLGLYNQNLFRAGLSFAPIRHQSGRAMHRMLFNGGINYDMLTFDSDNVFQLPGTARGFGYYLSTGYNALSLSGLSCGFGVSYESKNPKMTGALEALGSNEFQILARLGYFFHF